MSVRPPKRSFLWPVVESTHRVRIKGDGDVGIKGIAFSSDGSQFVVNCECPLFYWFWLKSSIICSKATIERYGYGIIVTTPR